MSPWLALVEVARDGSAVLDALKGQMSSLRGLVETTPEHTFRASPSDSSGSVGEHVRHCLDHVRALTAAVNADEFSYDSRLRGTPVETHPTAAIEEIDRLLQALDDLDDETLARSLCLRTLMRRGTAPVSVRTTLEREAAFVVQHTIHHCATMAVLLESMRISVPHDFGYAPSTPPANPRG
jgi:uncharacterized damage-inducible protein DinB